jgi:hypothetical protein
MYELCRVPDMKYPPHSIIAVIYDKQMDGKRVVLTTGAIGDFAAYEGASVQSNSEIASYGDKIEEQRARKIFCDYIKDEDKYRI